MAVREWHMQLALKSYRSLVDIVDQLTEEEVLAAIELEKASLRRKSLLDRLIQQAVDLYRQKLTSSLKEK